MLNYKISTWYNLRFYHNTYGLRGSIKNKWKINYGSKYMKRKEYKQRKSIFQCNVNDDKMIDHPKLDRIIERFK